MVTGISCNVYFLYTFEQQSQIGSVAVRKETKLTGATQTKQAADRQEVQIKDLEKPVKYAKLCEGNGIKKRIQKGKQI